MDLFIIIDFVITLVPLKVVLSIVTLVLKTL